jgi:hypothetical protein
MSDYTAIRSWLHRRGIARVLNCDHQSGPDGLRLISAYVETALPLKFLAHYAAHDPLVKLYHGRIAKHHHMGLLRRRWMLKP